MKVSKSGLFLFELIVAVFLFTVCAAICIIIFAGSHTISAQSENITRSSLKAETAAEVFKSTDGGGDAIVKAFESDASAHDMVAGERNGIQEYTLNLYFDEGWENTEKDNAEYVLTMDTKPVNHTKTGYVMLAKIRIVRNEEDEPIYEMDVKKYRAEDSGEYWNER